MKYVRIPMERVAILIGHKGETKRELEDRSGITLIIDSRQGEVVFNEDETDDPLMALKMENIVRAIARGFSPKHAMRLFNDDANLYIFDIHDYVGKKESHVRRLKSRIIGRNGKTKRVLERLTDSDISVYGHTVSVISDVYSMNIIKKAIDMLLEGSKHATVYRFVESSMKSLRLEREFGL